MFASRTKNMSLPAHRLPWRHRLLPALALATTLVFAGRSGAHALGAECKVNGARVELEAYFDDDTPARDARVRVEHADGQQVATGCTDAKGRWSFARPRPGHYVVIVDAGAGHRTQLQLTLAPGPTDADSTTPPDGMVTAEPIAGPADPTSATVSAGPGRHEFTSWPWTKLGIGTMVLAGVGAAFWIACRMRAPAAQRAPRA
jgi:nickel transport protein